MPGQTIPRFEGAFVKDGSALGQGNATPDAMGLLIYNTTGSALTAGQIIYVSGWSASAGLPTVSLSDNHVAGAHAQYIVPTTIPNNASGQVNKHWLSAANLNTGGSTIGNPVYLDSTLGAGAGTWTLTANSGPTNRLEIVGRVVVVDPAVGQIDFDVQSNKAHVFGTNEFQPLAIGSAAIAVGSVTPDKQGLTVWNATGATIPVNSLVYVSGWNAGQSMPQVSLAANNVANAGATFVCPAAITNGNSGIVRKHFLSAANLNTNSNNVGDPAYLDAVPGGYTLTAPTAPTSRQQVVGRVVVVSATVGQIDFDVVSSGGTVISRADIQPGDVNPDDSGITAWNATGSTITAGQLVYVSGYNVANSLPQISLAVNNVANSNATYIVPANIPNGASGQCRRHWTSAANLNTNAFAPGANIWLDATAGGWTGTQPTGAGQNQQVVGHVIVQSATVGQIDFDVESNPASVFGTTALQTGTVSPDRQGLTIWNATGSTLTAGQLVYLSGWNVANSLPQVSLSANNVQGAQGHYIVPAAINNGASGLVVCHWLSAANLNTNAQVAGSPVYLDAVAGGWTLTAPVGASNRQQIVGRVVVQSATVGQIDFDLSSQPDASINGTNELQALCVTAAKIAAATITQAKMATASVYPDQQALNVWNATGSSLTAGQLVYVSGWNVANSLPQVSLAANNVANQFPAYVVPATIANGAAGVVQRHWLSAANLNTNAQAAGSPVYLDSVAGGWTLTLPAGSSNNVVIVGRVVVQSASVGQIDFDLSSQPGTTIGNASIQNGAIGTAWIANNAITGALLASPLTLSDPQNIVLGTSTGTQIGTATTQKLGFFGATPVVQITGGTDVLASLVTLGLRAASSNPPLNLGTGALTCGAATVQGSLTLSTQNLVTDTATGSQIATATTQKLGFFGATPVVQQAGNSDVLASLVTLGLRAASSNPPLNLGTGALTCGAATVQGALTLSTQNLVTDTTTGSQIGTASTQKLGFFGATPIVAPTGYSVTTPDNTTKTLVGDGTDTAATLSKVCGNVFKQLLNLGLIHA